MPSIGRTGFKMNGTRQGAIAKIPGFSQPVYAGAIEAMRNRSGPSQDTAPARPAQGRTRKSN